MNSEYKGNAGGLKKMADHGHGVELLQGVHGSEEQHHNTTTLHSLHSSRKEVGGQGLKILQNAHPKGVTEHLVGLLVVSVTNLSGGDEHLKGVVLVGIKQSPLHCLLDLLHPLLAMAKRDRKENGEGKGKGKGR